MATIIGEGSAGSGNSRSPGSRSPKNKSGLRSHKKRGSNDGSRRSG